MAGAERKHKILFFIETEVAEAFPSLISSVKKYSARWSDLIASPSRPVIMDGGETLKSFDDISEICKIINDRRLCRHSFVCIIGGGAFLDKIGFATSIVHRGLRQIRFPTTVLAQNDSGVGVKNGINMFGKKNFVGTFSPPYAVVNDFNFLSTLSKRDWISGTAEAFKVALIKDASFFGWLCKNAKRLSRRDSQTMEEMIYNCAKIHVDQIGNSGDPFEFGSARPLDFGHWSAHKLEALSDGKLRHGEAVAIGILLDSVYARKTGLFSGKDLARLERALKTVGFDLWNSLIEKKDSKGRFLILSGIEEFREHLGGVLHITMPSGLGKKIELNEIDENTMLDSIRYLRKFRQK